MTALVYLFKSSQYHFIANTNSVGYTKDILTRKLWSL